MKIMYLVTLFIIGTAANVVPRQSKGCECDSFISQNGWGNCERFETDGRTLCYVKNPSTSTCPDLKQSTTDIGKSWSYKACEYATNKPTTSVYKLSPENSLCDQMRAKSFSKVDTEDECRKVVDVVRNEVPAAKFMKVETVQQGAGFPRGCYLWVPNSGIYFNNNLNRAVHKSARQICKEDGISDDCDRDSDCAGQETCQAGKCGCGARQSCVGDKAAPTCNIVNNVGQCICGQNDGNGNGVANVVVASCRAAATRQIAPTCSNLGQINNPTNFQCVCGSKGPCKAGTICEKDVNGKEKCVVKCPAACPGVEVCDTFHRICRCGVSTSCDNFPRAPVCTDAGTCVCGPVGAANAIAACPVGERCEIDGGGAGTNRCRCGNNPPCGARGQCIEGECRCGAVGGNGCAGATPTCNFATNVCRACNADGNAAGASGPGCRLAVNAAGAATTTCDAGTGTCVV